MIEAYPFFLQKDSEPFKFEIIQNSTHEIINLSAKVHDDLDFRDQIAKLETLKNLQKKKCLIEIDFGFNHGFDFNNQIKFSSCVLAIEEILKSVLRPFKDIIDGLILFRGTAYLETIYTSDGSLFDHIDQNLESVFEEETNLRLAAATVLGTIFHRLVSFVDDDTPCFAIFNDAETLLPLDRAILFSKQRFEHIFLVFSNPEFQSTNIDLTQGLSALGYFCDCALSEAPAVDVGVLLPEDSKLTPHIINKLKELIDNLQVPYRVISEKIFNECWNDIQTVYYATNSLHPMTLRMIKGFEASGGESIEI